MNIWVSIFYAIPLSATANLDGVRLSGRWPSPCLPLVQSCTTLLSFLTLRWDTDGIEGVPKLQQHLVEAEREIPVVFEIHVFNLTKSNTRFTWFHTIVNKLDRWKLCRPDWGGMACARNMYLCKKDYVYPLVMFYALTIVGVASDPRASILSRTLSSYGRFIERSMKTPIPLLKGKSAMHLKNNPRPHAHLCVETAHSIDRLLFPTIFL